MDFIIVNEIVEEEKYRNKYKLEIETLKLNNDSSENTELITLGYYSSKELNYLKELVTLLEEIKLYIKNEEYSINTTYHDSLCYEHLNNFNKWFNRSYLTFKEIKDLPSKVKEQKWVWDLIYIDYTDSDFGYSYLLDYKITYIDKKGRNFNVEISM